MELVNPGQEFKVIVDYAHEPLSLTELFTNLRKCTWSAGKINRIGGIMEAGVIRVSVKKWGRLPAGSVTWS